MSKTVTYSSVAKKIIMSLAGLFLTSFLVIHLLINLLILFDKSLELFNQAAHFMATNPLIQTFQYVLFLGLSFTSFLGLCCKSQTG